MKANHKSKDAVSLLKEDHAAVDALFKRFESARSESVKQTLVEEICLQLKVHAQIEEEIFYPALREALDETDILDEAAVEHASAKQLIKQLEGSDLSDPMDEARVKVLAEYIRHHVKEEQREIFPKAKSSELDMKALGEELVTRKMELLERAKESPRAASGNSKGTHSSIAR